MGMRTKRDAAIAAIKGIQDRLQKEKQGEHIPADKVSALFSELVGAVKDLSEAPARDVDDLTARRMAFSSDIRVGDEHYRRQHQVNEIPVDVQKQMDTAVIVATLLKKDVRQTKSWKRLMEGGGEYVRALDNATAGEGLEWVPTGFSPSLIAEVTVLGGIEQLHPTIVMPTPVYKVPLQLGRLTAYKVPEQTADSGQTAGTKSSGEGMTGALTLTASGIQAEVLVSKNLQEDSIVAMMPLLRPEIVMSIKRAIEEACLNGDTTGSHQDSDVSGADDRRKLWKGFRKHSIEQGRTVDFAGTGNGLDWETILKIRAKLGKYGINPGDLYWLSGLSLYFKLLSLKDTHGNAIVTTIDKLGANATVATGVLGKLGGSDVMVSEFMREDLTSAGVYGSGETKTGLGCVHKPGFAFGDRRDVTMQVLTELYAEYQQDALLVTARKDFQPIRPIASHAAVAMGLDIETA